MKILVLGGGGFIGSHIVNKLSLDNSNEIIVYGRSLEQGTTDNVQYIRGDFSDTVRLGEALIGVDVVVHSISSTFPSTSNLDPIADINQNLISTVRLLQLIKENKNIRLIYISSGGTVYGIPHSLPVSESHPLNPISSYGVIKVAIENYINMFSHLYGLNASIIRPSNPYGPNQAHVGVQGVLTTFLLNNLQNKKSVIWGDGEVKRGFVYIDDLVNFVDLLIKSDKQGVFNICSGISYSLNELIKIIELETGKVSKIERQTGRQFDIPDIYLDISNAKNVLGWHPKFSLNEGVSKFANHLKKI
jgi:UDP-glucose 4-epimerase